MVTITLLQHDVLMNASRIGTCVGARNYRYFVSFVLSTVMLCSVSCIVCGLSISQAISPEISLDQLTSSQQIRLIASSVLLFFIFLIDLSLLPLAFYHCKLIAINQTTNENVTSIPPISKFLNLFGFVYSFVQFLTRPNQILTTKESSVIASKCFALKLNQASWTQEQ